MLFCSVLPDTAALACPRSSSPPFPRGFLPCMNHHRDRPRARAPHSLVKLVTIAPLHAAMILCLSLFRERACRRLALSSSCSSSVLIVIGDIAGASTGSAGMLRLAMIRCAMRAIQLLLIAMVPAWYVCALLFAAGD